MPLPLAPPPLPSSNFPPIRGQHVYHWLNRFGGYIFFFSLAILVFGFTAFRVSGSSVGFLFQRLHGSEVTDPSLLWGQPRGIRSDEYQVSTAWSVSQATQGFPTTNELYGVSGQSLVFYDIPVKDFTLVFKPHNWVFLILPLENAFAFRWWFRAFLFLLASYWLLHHFTHQNTLFAILGSLALFFTPYFQWWYSVTLMDITTYYFLLFACLIHMVAFRSPTQLFFLAVLFAYFAVILVFFFYPPTQISIGWLFVLLAAAYLLQKRSIINRTRIRWLAAAFTFILLLVAVFLFAFVWKYQQPLHLITNTVYPGQRSLSGKGIPFTTLLGGFYNVQLQNESAAIPEIFPGNQSEASSFFFFGIFLIPVVVFTVIWEYVRDRKINYIPLILSFIFALFLLWVMVPPPGWLASWLFIASVRSSRVILALGIINNILIMWYLFYACIPKDYKFLLYSGLYAACISMLIAAFGLFLKIRYSAYLSSLPVIIAIVLFVGFTFFLLLQKKHILFITALLVFSFLSSYQVNPLYQGLGELVSGNFSQTVRSINNQDDSARWVLYGTGMPNILQANGIKALNGVYYYPDFALSQLLDPQGQYISVYNRYSQVFFFPEENAVPRFKLNGNDNYFVYINPCSPLLIHLDVKYQVFREPQPYACLRQIRQIDYPPTGFYIYETLNSGE